VAIPLTPEFAPRPAALIDGDQTLIVEPREGDPKLAALVHEVDDSEVKRGMAVAGRGRKGTRAEYRCAACGYGIVVYEQPPSCLMCSEARWEHVEWRPLPRLLDDFALPGWHPSPATSPPRAFLTNSEPIRHLRPVQA
jgi:hypothetical protein